MIVFFFAALSIGEFNAGNRHVLEVCRGLIQQGNRVYLFAAWAPASDRQAIPHGLQVIEVPMPRTRWRALNTIAYYIFLPFWASPHFLRMRPQVVYTRFSFLDWIAIRPLKALFKFDYIGEVNGILSLESGRSGFGQYLISLMEGCSLRLCDKVIGVTEELRLWAQKKGNLEVENTKAIGNGVDIDVFRPVEMKDACQHLKLVHERPRLGFVGSMKPWHDLSTVIEALPLILQELPQTLLVMVGDGPERDGLVKLAEELKVSESIWWVGIVPGEQVLLYINAYQVCLAPFSQTRNDVTGVSPIKVYEYMSCGRPFVTSFTNSTYDKEVQSWKSGLIVPVEDPAALAEAAIALLRDERYRDELGARGRDVALENFSWSRIAEQIDAFIKS